MKGIHRAPETPGIAADFVQRNQAAVFVERGILEPLSHHRRRILLELHDKLQQSVGTNLCRDSLELQHPSEKVEHRFVSGAAALFTLLNRPFNVLTVLFSHL